jgi:hypothetical protein
MTATSRRVLVAVPLSLALLVGCASSKDPGRVTATGAMPGPSSSTAASSADAMPSDLRASVERVVAGYGDGSKTTISYVRTTRGAVMSALEGSAAKDETVVFLVRATGGKFTMSAGLGGKAISGTTLVLAIDASSKLVYDVGIPEDTGPALESLGPVGH